MGVECSYVEVSHGLSMREFVESFCCPHDSPVVFWVTPANVAVLAEQRWLGIHDRDADTRSITKRGHQIFDRRSARRREWSTEHD